MGKLSNNIKFEAVFNVSAEKNNFGYEIAWVSMPDGNK